MQWDWYIVVDENTDDAGWQYGGCGFWELRRKRLAARSRPRRWDFVRRRKWVHRDIVEVLKAEQVRAPNMTITQQGAPVALIQDASCFRSNANQGKASRLPLSLHTHSRLTAPGSSMQRGNLRFLDPKEMYASNLNAQKKLDEVGGAHLGGQTPFEGGSLLGTNPTSIAQLIPQRPPPRQQLVGCVGL